MKIDYSKGFLLALLTALISGVSVFINGTAVKLADPFVYTTLKNFGALIFLVAIVLGFNEFHHFRNLSRKQWVVLVLIGIVGGSVPFLMFFWGLKLGGATVSSFIFRSLFLFAGVFGYFILKERPELRDLAAGLLIMIGNSFLLSGEVVFGIGQILVLGATIFWALEYTLSRKILADVNPRVVMVSRMLFGSIILIGFLVATGATSTLSLVNVQVLEWLVLTSFLLTAFLIAWYSALKHLPVFRATIVLALGGIVTAALEALFLGKAITLFEGLGLTLTLVGVFLATSFVELIHTGYKLRSKSLVE
jgi:drug/metabolite transporter (DMT)-like permease